MTVDYFQDWKERESLAEAMIPLIGRLYRHRQIVTSIFGRSLINRSVIDLLKTHKFVRQIEDSELSVRDTLPVLEMLNKMDLSPARIDVGKLAVGYRRDGEGISLETYISGQLKEVLDSQGMASGSGQDIVLYGFGRIGRLMARILIGRAGGGSGLNLRAIVVRPSSSSNDLQKRASLLRRDFCSWLVQGDDLYG